MSSSNYISKVAIVGAGGNSGKFMVEALLKTGKHTVTALTRADSQSKLPDGVIKKQVDYDSTETLIDALKGIDALVITLGGYAPKDTDMKLINAASEAGVKWILPNEWAPDTANEDLVKDVFVFKSKPAIRGELDKLKGVSYIAVSTGFWYEWSLGISSAFGFDFANRAVTYFDKGETKISTTTWPQIGRAVAALLSLPMASTGAEKSTCLEDFANKVIYTSSFTVSQKDMFASVLRVTDTTASDWSITEEPARDRYAAGLEQMQAGERIGFAKMMYTRVFHDDGVGNVERSRGTVNAVLGLPEEDMDEATKIAIERSKTSPW